MAEPPDAEPLAARVAAWLRWVDEDLVQARELAANPRVVSRGACGAAHQCAEKSLKGAVVATGVDPPKTHNLLRLFHLVPASLRQQIADVDLEGLYRWAIEGRYPDELDEATAADAEEAITAATAVLEAAQAFAAAAGEIVTEEG